MGIFKMLSPSSNLFGAWFFGLWRWGIGGHGAQGAGAEIGIVEGFGADDIILAARIGGAAFGVGQDDKRRGCGFDEQRVIADEGHHDTIEIKRVFAEHAPMRQAQRRQRIKDMLDGGGRGGHQAVNPASRCSASDEVSTARSSSSMNCALDRPGAMAGRYSTTARPGWRRIPRLGQNRPTLVPTGTQGWPNWV